MATIDDARQYGMLMIWGGMCWVDALFNKNTGNDGPRGLFAYTFNTPAVVAACVDDDFAGVVDHTCYYDTGKAKAHAHVWHNEYSDLRNMMTPKSRDKLRAWNSNLFGKTWPWAAACVPAMFQHLSPDCDLKTQLQTMERRAARTRLYLHKKSWKVMVWGGAIPHSYLESLLEQNPDLRPAEVFQALMDVLVAEIEELHNSLIRYGCKNFVLIGMLVVHGTPSADTPYDRRKWVDSASPTERSVARVVKVASNLCGARFKHADGDQEAQLDREHLTGIVKPYMAWQECGPDTVYNCYYWHNKNLPLSIWGDQAGEKGSTDDQAAHAVHDLSEPYIEKKRQGTAPLLIVSDSTLLPRSVPRELLTFFMYQADIMGGSGQIFSKLPGRMQDEILAGAVRRAQDTGRVRVGYVPLHQCGQWPRGYSEYGRVQAEQFKALAALGYDLVAVPTIEDFARMYREQHGGSGFFPPTKGAHYAPDRRKWLGKALGMYGKDHDLSMIFCLGWNCPSREVLNAELAAQAQLVQLVQYKAEAGTSRAKPI